MSSLVERRDFSAAIAYYESSSSQLSAAAGSSAAGALRLAAMAYSSLTKYPVALRTARLAQHVLADSEDSELLAEVFLTIGGILRNMGEFKEAEKAIRDAESIFRRNDHLEGQSRALNLLAGLFFKRMEVKQALPILLDAIEIVRKLNDTRKLAYMMGNVGRIYSFTGDFAKAKKHLKINAELSADQEDFLELARANLSLAYVHLLEGKPGDAKQALQVAYPHIIESKSARDEVMYLAYLGEVHYHSGSEEKAQKILQEALTKSERIAAGSRLTGRILRHLAEVSIRLNKPTQANRFVNRALVIMTKFDDKVGLGAALRIKAVLAEISKQRTAGRDLFVRALGIHDRTGIRVEKAETLLAAGSSQLFSHKRRLIYLYRAQEFYSSARLAGKVRQIDELIAALDYQNTSAPSTADANLTDSTASVGFITACPRLKQFKKQLPMVARSDIPVLLTGETGVGKDQMARYYHSLARPDGPFVAVNCASIPETLLESELFGYKKGAFTGADRDNPGRIAAANKGVIYLDEIGDMPLWLQAKLLGVLETHRVSPLGSTVETEIDFKLIAATNRDLEAMVAEGTFRRDLFYRISGIGFCLPPLRERPEDIPILLQHFISRGKLGCSNNLPSELVRQFLAYSWPGNVRELSNKVKRLEVMAELVAEGDIAELSRAIFPDEQPAEACGSLFDRVEQLERQLITEALLATRGNKSEAARLLGIHEATVRTKLKRYGISAADCRAS